MGRSSVRYAAAHGGCEQHQATYDNGVLTVTYRRSRRPNRVRSRGSRQELTQLLVDCEWHRRRASVARGAEQVGADVRAVRQHGDPL